MGSTITLSNIPVFPLNTVLFPKMPLALHVFEDRYKQMVRDLPMTANRFCVALIREGMEVGGEADPHSTGCLAEVSTLRPLPDERFFINAYGTLRVKIVSLDRTSRPYLLGTLELWPEEGDPPQQDLVSRVSRQFSQYARHIMELAGKPATEFALPADPRLLSYLIASVLQITTARRQELLSMPGSAQRLQAELDILQTELPLLKLMVRGPKPPPAGKGPFSAN